MVCGAKAVSPPFQDAHAASKHPLIGKLPLLPKGGLVNGISPENLRHLLNAPVPPLIIDVRSEDACTPSKGAIPNAIRRDPGTAATWALTWILPGKSLSIAPMAKREARAPQRLCAGSEYPPTHDGRGAAHSLPALLGERRSARARPSVRACVGGAGRCLRLALNSGPPSGLASPVKRASSRRCAYRAAYTAQGRKLLFEFAER